MKGNKRYLSKREPCKKENLLKNSFYCKDVNDIMIKELEQLILF